MPEGMKHVQETPEKKTINVDDLNIPSAPGFSERIKNSIERRKIQFDVYTQTMSDRKEAGRSSSLATRIDMQLKNVTQRLHDEQQHLRNKETEFRGLKRGDTLLGATVKTLGMGEYIAGLRANRLNEEKADIEQRIAKLQATIAEKTPALETARAEKALYQERIVATAEKLSEPIERKRVQTALELENINTAIKQYEEHVLSSTAEITDLHARIHAAEQSLRTENLSATERARLTKLQDTASARIEDIKDERGAKRTMLDKSYRHRARVEKAYRSLTGGKDSIMAQYDQRIEEVARPSMPKEAEDILTKSREFSGSEQASAEPEEDSTNPYTAERQKEMFGFRPGVPDGSKTAEKKRREEEYTKLPWWKKALKYIFWNVERNK